MIRRLALAVATFLVVSSWPAATVSAHGASDHPVTGDFRTRITAVTPPVPGLEVRIADLDGLVEVTWSGDGELTMLGYEGEPYLRIDSGGVWRNVRSPATYLNAERYGGVPVPPEASAAAEPQWESLSGGNSVSWHDHRTHYMSPGQPPQTEGAQDPVVIIPRWEIGLQAATTPVVVSGDLTWYPPPSRWAWVVAAVLGAAGLLSALLLVNTAWARPAAWAGVAGTALFAADSLGYLAAWPRSAGSTAWLVGWPLIAAGAFVSALLGARHLGNRDAACPDLEGAASRPPVGLAAGALVLAVVGGYDRLDVVQHALVDSSLPAWTTRVAAVGCLAVGTAVLLRYLIWLVPAVLRAPAADTRPTLPAPAPESPPP